MDHRKDEISAFEAEARRARKGFLSETLGWLGHNKKWWLLPIVLAMLLLGVLVMVGGASWLSPWIYTLF